jgi:DNA-binding HxlR family transcriptional regulator
MLNSRGLISANPKGKWVFYAAKANPNVAHASTILKALEVSCDNNEDNKTIMFAATAFTHERRIAIAKQLSKGSMASEGLSIATQISPQSLYRHLRKMIDRGIAAKVNDEYQLATPENPLAKTLLSIAVQ